jgi:ENTS family enterobactin (siderophore) exporter
MRQLRESAELLSRRTALAALIALAVVGEIFGFSAMALDPVLAGSVFATGSVGLGLIVASRSLGRLVGTIGLIARPPRNVGGPLIAAVMLLGAATTGYAVSPTIGLAIMLVAVAGLAGGIVDSLEQSAFQMSVGEHERGSATGIWVLTLGLGPIGIAALTGAAEVVDPRLTLAISGLALAAFGLLFWGTSVREIAADDRPE